MAQVQNITPETAEILKSVKASLEAIVSTVNTKVSECVEVAKELDVPKVNRNMAKVEEMTPQLTNVAIGDMIDICDNAIKTYNATAEVLGY